MMENESQKSVPLAHDDGKDSVSGADPDSVKTSEVAAYESCKLVAAIRAVNSEDPSVDFQEPLAAYLAGDDWLNRIRARQELVYNKGFIHPVSFRCRLVDEAIVQACDEHDGIRQVVLLGAGMDTRPYRLELANVKWFEVDVPTMSSYKQQKIESIPTNLKEHAKLKTQSHHYIPIDLATSLPDLVGTLESVGFNPNAPILYVMEGLVYYLTAEENLLLMDALPVPPLSQAVVTCLSPAILAYGRNPAEKPKTMDGSLFASWKLDSEEYKQVVDKSQHWSLDKEVNMNEEAVVNRGYSMANVRGNDMTKVSEHLLILRPKNDGVSR